MTLISRYTFKDLRLINRLSIEELSCKTLIPSQTLTEIEKDSSNISFEVARTLSQFYRLSTNYIFLGKQSEFEAQQLDEMIQSTPLAKRLSVLEVAKLEEILGLTPYTLTRDILKLSKEGQQ